MPNPKLRSVFHRLLDNGAGQPGPVMEAVGTEDLVEITGYAPGTQFQINQGISLDAPLWQTYTALGGSVEVLWKGTVLAGASLTGTAQLVGTEQLAVTGEGGVRGNLAKSRGKRFFSVVGTASTGSPMAVGLAVAGANTGAFPGDNDKAVGLFVNGYIGFSRQYTQVLPPFTGNQILDVAVDLDARRMWFRVNGGPWNGQAQASPNSPATGYSIAGLVGELVPALHVYNGTLAVNFGYQGFAYPMPQGYMAWRDSAYKAKTGAGVWGGAGGPTHRFVEGTQPEGGAPFGWYYNWKPQDDVYPVNSAKSVEFVPMIWGPNDLGAVIPPESKFLLTYNEPDGTGGGHQANTSVEKALSDWPTIQDISGGRPIVSPGCQTANTLGSTSWLRRFMNGVEAQGLRVDYMAVHWYTTNPDVAAFKTFLDNVYAQYGKKIWVTEWALVDWANEASITAAQAAAYAQAALPMLLAHPHVFRECYFSPLRYRINVNRPYTNSHMIDNLIGTRTAVGTVFNEALNDRLAQLPPPVVQPEEPEQPVDPEVPEEPQGPEWDIEAGEGSMTFNKLGQPEKLDAVGGEGSITFTRSNNQ